MKDFSSETVLVIGRHSREQSAHKIDWRHRCGRANRLSAAAQIIGFRVPLP
jgi:hypothetical protein